VRLALLALHQQLLPGDALVYHALQAKQSSIWTSFFGHVSELDFMGSHQESKLIAIDKQATDNVMHLYRLGKIT